MEKLDRSRFASGLLEASRRLRIPRAATFELSYGCNLACRHCFNPTHRASPRELSKSEVFRIVDEIAALGVFELCLTGGEPFLRPDFCDVVERARSLGLVVTMNTNATRATPAAAERLARAGVEGVYASLYGATAPIYESVTGVLGSFARFEAGLDALTAAGLPVTLQMPLMTLNAREFEVGRAYARARGLGFKFTFEISPRQDGDLSPLAVRLSPADKLRLVGELDELPGCAGGTDEPPFVDCDCGRAHFAITPYGEMNLCTVFPTPRYDLRRGSVREGWEVLKKTVDDARPNARFECPSCDLRDACRQGRADAWLEARDMSACLPHYKELARAEKEARGPARSVR